MAVDDVRILVGTCLDGARSLVDLGQREVGTASDGEQHAGSARDGCLEQVGVGRLLRRVERTVLARRDADAHHRRARVLHDRADVREVEVDETRDGDEVGDALDALAQGIVGDAERVEHARLLVDDFKQSVVRDDDERIDLLGEQIDALISLVATKATLEGEGLRHDAGQRADFLTRDFCDDGSGARARAAAFAGSDEDHVGLGECLANLCTRLLGCLAPHFGVRARTKPARKLVADVDRLIGIRHEQSLAVGVDGNELDALHARFNHAVHGIGTAAAYADDLDDRQMLGTYCVWHCILHTCCD